MLTHERLRDVLSYDPSTGVFTWLLDTGKKRMVGNVAGYLAPDGRVSLRIDGTLYRAHRLAWFHVHGAWPSNEIDHVNGNPADNRLSNLREASHQQNMANRKRAKHNASGVKGVYFNKQCGKWRASIRVDGRNRHIGHFADKHAAGQAYLKAATEIFGDFATARD